MSTAQVLAGGVWAQRARAEEEAALHFVGLATGLEAIGAPADAVSLAQRAVADERRHARRCAALAVRLGAAPPPPQPAGCSATPAPTGSDRLEVLKGVVAMSCVTEVVSATLLAEMLRHAKDPAVRATVHEVLRDEVLHGRIGWAVLAAGCTRAERARLAAALPGILARTVTDELFLGPEVDDAGAHLAPLGVLPRASRHACFVAAVEQVVLPGMAKMGVDPQPAAAWLAARTSPEHLGA